jgi:hypothetical protein
MRQAEKVEGILVGARQLSAHLPDANSGWEKEKAPATFVTGASLLGPWQ